MDALAPPDSHHLSAAAGWMELGNLNEARAELARVRAEFREHPDVLEVTWGIHAAASDWGQALCAAERLVVVAGDQVQSWLHRAYALRRVPEGGLQAAWEALRPAADRFSHEATVLYNLACYACQLQRLDEAREWFRRAMATGGKTKIKTLALSDRDLEPLWPEIKSL